MTEAEKLCERLGSHMGKADMQEVLRDCRSAAAMIAAQAAEIVRLREGLVNVRDYAHKLGDCVFYKPVAKLMVCPL